jgi:hypothetical protein
LSYGPVSLFTVISLWRIISIRINMIRGRSSNGSSFIMNYKEPWLFSHNFEWKQRGGGHLDDLSVFARSKNGYQYLFEEFAIINDEVASSTGNKGVRYFKKISLISFKLKSSAPATGVWWAQCQRETMDQ